MQQEENSSCISSASKCGRQRTANALFQAASAHAADAAATVSSPVSVAASDADAEYVVVWRADADAWHADADAWHADAWHADVEHADAWHADAEHADELQAAAWFAVDVLSRWKYSDVVR